jgi:hypothetical protein
MPDIFMPDSTGPDVDAVVKVPDIISFKTHERTNTESYTDRDVTTSTFLGKSPRMSPVQGHRDAKGWVEHPVIIDL